MIGTLREPFFQSLEHFCRGAGLAKITAQAHNFTMKLLRPLAVSLLGVGVGLLAAAQLPHRWCMREGGR